MQSHAELEQSIHAVLDEQGLQKPAGIVTKALQLYETLNVRFGVMVVGPSGSGKTQLYKTLQASLLMDLVTLLVGIRGQGAVESESMSWTTLCMLQATWLCLRQP